MLTALFARFLLTRVGKMLPSWAWELVFIALLAGAGMLAHHVAVVKHDNGVRAEQKASDDAAAKRLADHAIEIKRQVDGLTMNISNLIRTKNDEENRRIAAAGNDLRVLGPGAAACPRHASLPASPGGHGKAPAVAGAAGPLLPAPDSAAVPWSWLVDRAEEHDELLAEVKAWRQWHDQVLQAWPKNTGAAPR